MFPSPLIDQGTPAAAVEGEKDFAGRPRIIDGDGDGAARRDIGALEYQRQAPVVTATVTPASGSTSQAFGLSSSAIGS